jgi:very-short-patch-repair endonuclease
VAEIAANQWGVVSTADLHRCGLSDNAISTRVQRGWLHPLHRGVYAVGHARLIAEGQFMAAVKACGDGTVLSHFAGAAHWAVVKWDDRYPDVTVPGRGTRRHRGIRIHQSSAIEATIHKHIPVTTPARTLVDLASVLPYQPLRRAVRQAFGLKLVTPRELTAAMQPNRRGTANLTRILATGHTPTRSELEDAVLDLIVGGGLVVPDVNRPMTINGRRVIPDFRWPERRLVIEADGAEWHDFRLAREDDGERQAILEAHGERVVRITWDQAVRKPAQTLARLGAAGAPKLPGQ